MKTIPLSYLSDEELNKLVVSLYHKGGLDISYYVDVKNEIERRLKDKQTRQKFIEARTQTYNQNVTQCCQGGPTSYGKCHECTMKR
jgi:hypothetical protein